MISASRRSHALFCTMVLSAVIAAGCTGSAARKPLQPGPLEQRFTVLVKRYEFIPATFTVRRDKRVVMRFKSADIAYGVRLPALGLSTRIPAKGESTLIFTPNRKGSFAILCSAPTHQPGCANMRATLQVRD